MKPLQQANWRSVTQRMRRERAGGPFGPADAPLHGQVFVNLIRPRNTVLPLGFVCRKGEWDEQVHGNGLRGRVTAFEQTGGEITMSVEYRRIEGSFAMSNEAGTCRITMRRTNATELIGVFESDADGVHTEGPAMGYLHRPVPSTRV
jgi:hypothetical protein